MSSYPEQVEATVASSDWSEIAASIRSLWPEICAAANAFLAYHPSRAAIADRLRVYLRPDCGGLYFYICARPPRLWSSCMASITVPYIEVEYYKLAAQSEDEFERGHDILMSRIRSAIKASCAPELSPLPLRVVDYDDLEAEKEIREIEDAESP